MTCSYLKGCEMGRFDYFFIGGHLKFCSKSVAVFNYKSSRPALFLGVPVLVDLVFHPAEADLVEDEASYERCRLLDSAVFPVFWAIKCRMSS